VEEKLIKKTKKNKKKMAVTKKTTTKSKDPNEFEAIVVNGCLIEPDTIYEVVSKNPTANTPEVYKELGASKERFPGVSNTLSLSQHNTGFFAASEALRADKTAKTYSEKEEKANKLFEVFAEPLRTLIPDIDRIKLPSDNEFFDKHYESESNLFSVTLAEGVQFNTANPLSRFQLYIAIIEGELAMKGEREEEEKEIGLRDEMDVMNNDAQYAYISITKRKTRVEENAELEMECAYEFGNLLRTKKDLLVGMLQYISIPTSKTATKAELNTSYAKNIKGDRNKTKAFADVIAKYKQDPDNFEKEIEILEKLKTKKGRETVVKSGNTYYMGETPLGSNPKSVVSALMKDDELYKQFTIKTDEDF